MDSSRNRRPSVWIAGRIVVVIAIAAILGYQWHQQWISWPLVLMAAFVALLVAMEFVGSERQESRVDDPDRHPDGDRPAHPRADDRA
jgi:cell division protein FtsW (lipid II flippase)